MLKGDEQLVYIRTISGEQIMAVLEYESKDTVEISYPMQIKTYPMIAGGEVQHEHISASPWCRFASTPSVSLNKSHVLFVKNLHQAFAPHYARLVEQSEKQVIVKKEEPVDDWEDENVETVKDMEKRIDALARMLNQEEEISETTSIEVEGNDTVH